MIEIMVNKQIHNFLSVGLEIYLINRQQQRQGGKWRI